MGPTSRVVAVVLAVTAGLALAWAMLAGDPEPESSTSGSIASRAASIEADRDVRRGPRVRRVMVDGEPRKVAPAIASRADGVSRMPWAGPDTPRGARTAIKDLRHSLRDGAQKLAAELGLVGERAAAIDRLLVDAEARLDTLLQGINDGSVPLDGMRDRLVAERTAFSDAVLQVVGREHADAVYQRLGGRRP